MTSPTDLAAQIVDELQTVWHLRFPLIQPLIGALGEILTRHLGEARADERQASLADHEAYAAWAKGEKAAAVAAEQERCLAIVHAAQAEYDQWLGGECEDASGWDKAAVNLCERIALGIEEGGRLPYGLVELPGRNGDG